MRRTWPAPHPAGLRECPNPEHRTGRRHHKDPTLLYHPAGILFDGRYYKCRFCTPHRDGTADEFAAFKAGWLALNDIREIGWGPGDFDFWNETLWELYWDWRLPQERWDNEWGKRVH